MIGFQINISLFSKKLSFDFWHCLVIFVWLNNLEYADFLFKKLKFKVEYLMAEI